MGNHVIAVAGLVGAIFVSSLLVPAHAKPVREEMPYFEARKLLLAEGWKPTDYAIENDAPTPEAKALDETLRAEWVALGAREVGGCFPTGLGMCFAIWTRHDELFVVELPSEAKRNSRVYFYYQVRLHRQHKPYWRPSRSDWDMRSADVIPGSHPKWRRQW